jgi:hypothetical protein
MVYESSKVHIVDDFLSSEDHKSLHDVMLGDQQHFPWYISGKNSIKEGADDYLLNYQFTHPFFILTSQHGCFFHKSDKFDLILPILNKLNFIALHRVKANLEPLHPERHYSQFHQDYIGYDDRPCKKMSTAIYYVNHNDGYTEFSDGSIVESKANRFLYFRSDKLHRGVSQLDTRLRCVINFNLLLGN